MCSEEITISNRWGEKDVDWKKADADAYSLFKDEGYAPTIEVINNVWAVPTNKHWSQKGAAYRDYAVSLGQVASKNNINERFVAESTKAYLPYTDMSDVKKFVYDIDGIADINEINTNIESYVKEMTTLFVIGEKNADKEWDSYLKELDNMGANQLLDETQKAYDRANK